MATRLTKKQRGFVKDYIKTGIGSLAVKKNYDVSDDLTARTIASENLTKPNIQKAIAEMLPDDLLGEKHLALLNKVDENGEIDVIAVKAGLDMAYKIKNTYAPEKILNLNVDIDQEVRQKSKQAISEILNDSNRTNIRE